MLLRTSFNSQIQENLPHFFRKLLELGITNVPFTDSQPCSGADGYYVPTTGQNYELLCTTDLNTGSKIHVYNNDGVDSVQQCAQ